MFNYLRLALVAAAAACVAVGTIAQVQAFEPTQDRIVSANPENFTPNVEDGKVESMVQVGNRIIAVGKFTQVTPVGGPTVTRNSIFAFNATTGALDTTFVPNVGTKEVSEVVDAGDGTVFIGGLFGNVNGAAKTAKVARINATTGAVVSTFKSPAPAGGISDMQLVNGKLYIGGAFTAVGGHPRTLLAALNPTTGADTNSLAVTFTDTWNGGALGIKHFDISDDGSTLVAVGNFKTVDGLSRPQIVRLDLTVPTAAVSPWATTRYTTNCASVFDTYLRDVDIAPSGDYMVVVATGAQSGGAGSGTLCDSASRWELGTGTQASGQNPSWVEYSGGDTFTQTKITGAVVYVGGHFRWMNNPFNADSAGQGAVPRPGLAALDPRNGLPFTWNPTRARGVGVWEFLPTTVGLWVGHDTNQTGGETRKRIALFPLLGGTTLPAEATGTLPGDVYLLGQTAAASGHWIARVNTGGPTQLATDNGPDWAADTGAAPSPYGNGNSNAADWGSLPISRGANLPDSTPTGIFSTERWSPNDSPNMKWDFPAKAGDHLTVRLYFSNGCSCTASAGQRSFDVSIDGTKVLPTYDVVQDVGNQVGTMKSFDVTSDGHVNIDFNHVVENPLVNGIEIIDNDVATPGPGANDTVIDRAFDGSTASDTAASSGGQTWSSARGAVMIDGNVYTGWSDGTLQYRTFNGTTFGPSTNVNLYGLTNFAAEIPNITGMFYDKTAGRLYYTLSGQSQLYYRYFTPQSSVVGAVRFNGPADGNGVDFSTASGMLLTGGDLYVGSSTTGNLAKLQWSDGNLSGTAAQVSGPTIDGKDWRARGTFLYTG
jgi:hypothetical protein